ncbi:MAG: class I SAM-dependent methyltransferase [Oscillospiraceae bacterium]|nr:class I SAM-dependent methyltransferase [Oscillospiraceae bacterium]
MAYSKNFADIYDFLMYKDIDYAHWADYIENIFTHYDLSPDLVCDLACGTGNFTTILAKRGYDMTGVDISADMLSAARAKAADEGLDILFLNQDISRLDLYGSMGAFICMIDGFNYILVPSVLQNIFTKIHRCFLDPDGILIFDLSSYTKLKHTLGNNIFLHSERDMFYAWENTFHEKSAVSEMNLTFFRKGKSGYKRFSENHLQKAYTERQIVYMLKKAGFSSVDTFAEFDLVPPDKDAERIVFAARY